MHVQDGHRKVKSAGYLEAEIRDAADFWIAPARYAVMECRGRDGWRCNNMYDTLEAALKRISHGRIVVDISAWRSGGAWWVASGWSHWWPKAGVASPLMPVRAMTNADCAMMQIG